MTPGFILSKLLLDLSHFGKWWSSKTRLTKLDLVGNLSPPFFLRQSVRVEEFKFLDFYSPALLFLYSIDADTKNRICTSSSGNSY